MTDTATTTTWVRRFLAAALVLGALVVAGCGSNSNTTSSTPPATSTPATTSTPASSSSGSASGIPQGPNAGDKDSDNNGGPSDGDGNL